MIVGHFVNYSFACTFSVLLLYWTYKRILTSVKVQLCNILPDNYGCRSTHTTKIGSISFFIITLLVCYKYRHKKWFKNRRLNSQLPSDAIGRNRSVLTSYNLEPVQCRFATWNTSICLTHLPLTNWPSFRRRYFRMQLPEWKGLYFD